MSTDSSPYSFPTGAPPTRPEGSRWKALILGGAGFLLLVGGYQLLGRRGEMLARISASDARFLLAGGSVVKAGEINRGESPEVYYEVVLRDVPLGGRLELDCDWLDPSGRVARHNRYRTRFILKSTWPTHCRQRFGPGAPAGRWKVRLLMGERVLSVSSFVLR